MSDGTKGIRFNGTDEEWDTYVANLKKEGKTVGEDMTSIVRQKLTLSQREADIDNATASAHEKRLIESLTPLDLSKVIVNGEYHVVIDSIGLIQTAKHDLARRVESAVHQAISLYWINKWALVRCKLDPTYNHTQHISKLLLNDEKLVKFYETIEKVKVTFSVDIPVMTLSDLRESHLTKVVQFDCLIVGPTPKKLDSSTGKYIQYILIQEPEATALNNNPVMIKAVMHGEDTNNIASGMRKRIIGIYSTQKPKEGTKATNDKILIIDVINVSDLEEKAEVTLSPYEIETSIEFAEKHQEQYITALTNSFCPKILGRELEKKALWLSMLGGSDIVDYRKEIHGMLCADADSGKSELMKFADRIHWKSSLVDGSSSTGVGLTFALDEYDGLKILRRGAMVLNNNGCLFVDEYDKMGKTEQKKLNQAQEQQRATYNKGGHNANEECKTTVITACNPTNELWNNDKDPIDNLPFDPSTISRYDWIIRSIRETHENQIRAKMKHIARRKRGESDKVAAPEWLAGLLNYQRKLKPILPEDVENILIDKFVEFTQIEQDTGSIPIQTRQMEGIQRLCEAWAKMLFVKVITVKIVEDVIKFYQECMATLGMNVEKGITQFDLRGHSTNRDTYFEDVFRTLAAEDEEGRVSITRLSEKLQENTSMFNSDSIVATYVEKRKTSGWLYEPSLGVLKRQ